MSKNKRHNIYQQLAEDVRKFRNLAELKAKQARYKEQYIKAHRGEIYTYNNAKQGGFINKLIKQQ